MTDPLNPSFSYEIGVDLPSDRKRVRSFPPDQTRGESFLVRFTVGDDSWIGEFWEPGLRGGLTGVRAWLREDYAAVLVYGRCYLVNVRRPEDWRILTEPYSVLQFSPLPDEGLVLLASHIHLVCYSKSGLLWTSPRLVLDDLRVQQVAGARVRCSGYLPIGDHEFDVDLHTGKPLDDSVREFGLWDATSRPTEPPDSPSSP